jgi:xanthine/uracil/vitamin C permease (AzgA family)
MTQEDTIRSIYGIMGTGTSLLLSNAETAAAIFAGVATGLYMLVASYCKLRKPKK